MASPKDGKISLIIYQLSIFDNLYKFVITNSYRHVGEKGR